MSDSPNWEDELRELVDEWREAQEKCNLPRSGLTDEGHTYKQCADELEEVLTRAE